MSRLHDRTIALRLTERQAKGLDIAIDLARADLDSDQESESPHYKADEVDAIDEVRLMLIEALYRVADPGGEEAKNVQTP